MGSRRDSDASRQVVIVLRVTHPRTFRRSTAASELLARPRIFSFVYFRSSVDNFAGETIESVNHRDIFTNHRRTIVLLERIDTIGANGLLLFLYRQRDRSINPFVVGFMIHKE